MAQWLLQQLAVGPVGKETDDWGAVRLHQVLGGMMNVRESVCRLMHRLRKAIEDHFGAVMALVASQR